MRHAGLLAVLSLALTSPCYASDIYFAWAWPTDAPLVAYEMLYAAVVSGSATQTMVEVSVEAGIARCALRPEDLEPGERSVCGHIPCPPAGSYSFLLRAKRGDEYSDFSNIAQMGIGSACEETPFLLPRENPVIPAETTPMSPPIAEIALAPPASMPDTPTVQDITETPEDSPTTILTTYAQELAAIETSYMDMLTETTDDVPRATRHSRHHVRDLQRAYTRARQAQERAYQRALARIQRHMARYQARHQYHEAQEDE